MEAQYIKDHKGKIVKVKRDRRDQEIRAAQLYADANPSDPFAYGRMRAHQVSGCAPLASDVIKDSLIQIEAHAKARGRGQVFLTGAGVDKL